MRPFLRCRSTVNHKDLIRIFNRCQPVGNRDDCLPTGQFRDGFDCSGYICWIYTQSGVYNLSRTTAEGIYNQCAIVPREEARPGDLIFFTGTYASPGPVSHVGMYVGDGKMLHAGNPIGYGDLNSNFWRSHYYATGRLPGIP